MARRGNASGPEYLLPDLGKGSLLSLALPGIEDVEDP
jgi:hypothetical protein